VRATAAATLDHVGVEVSDVRRARRFYDRILPRLGFRRLPGTGDAWVGYRKGRTTVWLTRSRPSRTVRGTPHVPSNGARDPISDHLGFRVRGERQVRDLEETLRRGGLAPVYAADRVAAGASWYVSCAFQDPDHNVLEVFAVRRRR
jgi:catechol 2,3-dioxygenase-like lactoylglutathione lyase family enzyme